MTLVKILSQQLDANVEMSNSKKGLKCTFTFDKVENVRGSSSSFVM